MRSKIFAFCLCLILISLLGFIRVAHAEEDPTIQSGDAAGNPKNIFQLNDPVYVYGVGYGSLITYRVYIVMHPAIGWKDGDTIVNAVAFKDITSTLGGEIIPDERYPVWLADWEGKYDIIVDVTNYGIYDAGIDVIDTMEVSGAGFVVPEFSFAMPLVTSVVTCVYLLIRDKFSKVKLSRSRRRAKRLLFY